MIPTQTFIDFLASLPAEGETLLLVKQKPQRGEDGEFVYHDDGAIKATWPAFLPNHTRKPGESWYANTASYIVDRFKDGKPRATRDYCEHVLFLVLDDVGTKAKTPSLEPTWKLETSPGNFQWGYAFDVDNQPTKAEFGAAIKAIADAGFTDPGAVNPTRNVRLPESVNLKQGRGGYISSLQEFDGGRRFTLQQICDALGVTPCADLQKGEMNGVRIKDTGGDEVLGWLASNGLVLGDANLDGWREVVCPNSEAHSNGDPAGRYHGVDRGYLCYHGSCQHIKTAEFLKWIADNGGPEVKAGLREELIASRLGDALKRLRPTSGIVTPEEQAALRYIEETEAKERSRLEREEWGERYAYVESDDCYFDLVTRKVLTRTAFDAIYAHVATKSIHGGQKIKASRWFDENRNAMGAKTVAALTYAAGEGPICARDDGETYGNRWQDARPKFEFDGLRAGSALRWLEHCQKLVPNSDELQHILDVMACKVQRPRVKINHAVLHIGVEGCGKDTMWAPMIWATCGPHLRNRAIVNGDQIASQWGYAFESEVLILNELREPDARERRALANRLKPIIAAPPETITVNRKMLHPYEVANRLFVLAFSNEDVPITLSFQDRRWFIVHSTNAAMSEPEADAMWSWYAAGGYEAVANYLKARDLSKFNPAARPPITEAKTSVIDGGLSMVEGWLVEMVANRRGEFASGVIGAPFYGLLDRLQNVSPMRKDIHKDSLAHALAHAGWKDKGLLHSGDLPSKKHVWCAPEMASLPKSDLRRLAEGKPAQGNVLPFNPTGKS